MRHGIRPDGRCFVFGEPDDALPRGRQLYATADGSDEARVRSPRDDWLHDPSSRTCPPNPDWTAPVGMSRRSRRLQGSHSFALTRTTPGSCAFLTICSVKTFLGPMAGSGALRVFMRRRMSLGTSIRRRTSWRSMKMGTESALSACGCGLMRRDLASSEFASTGEGGASLAHSSQKRLAQPDDPVRLTSALRSMNRTSPRSIFCSASAAR